MKDTILRNVLDQIRAGKDAARLYPESTEREVWQKIGADHAPVMKFYLKRAETLAKEPIPVTRLSEAFRFQQDGNRSGYENPYFQRRNRLETFALACLFAQDEKKRKRYFNELLDSLGVILEEEYWSVPAHRQYEEGDPYAPSETILWVDLFAATTGATVGLVYHLFGKELAAVSPRLMRRIRDNVYQRVLQPIIEEKRQMWWLRKSYNNWTIWICNNLLTSALCVMDRTSDEFAVLLEKIFFGMEKFYGTYGEDGFCDEGFGYWTRAGAEIVAIAHRLESVFPGSAKTLIAEKKFAAMARFPLELNMSKTHHSAFSDGNPAEELPPIALCMAADLTGDLSLTAGTKKLAHYYKGRPMYWNETLRVELEQLFAKVKTGGCRKMSRHDTLFENRLAILRNRYFCASLKGGDNAENHNHNDLGQFALYCGELPVIIDLGRGLYCRQYFREERYTLVPSAKYHNAPLIGGTGQEFGRKYVAPLTYEAKSKTVTAHLKDAYPEAVGIDEMSRTVRLKGATCVVTDTLKQNGNAPVTVTLYSPVQSVKQTKSGALVFDKSVTMTLSGATVTELVQEEFFDPAVTRSWGVKFWRIEITANADAETWNMVFETEK